MKTYSQADIDLIWKHTHSDFKGSDGVEKCIMYPAHLGGLGPIKGLPEDVFQDKLAYAQRKEICSKRDMALIPIMRKHGALDAFESTMQWRDTLDDVISLASCVVDESKMGALIEDIKEAGVIFPN